MQGDLDRLGEWADAWQMQFNVDKCEVIHFGSKNRKADYYLNGVKLGKGEVQRDLKFKFKSEDSLLSCVSDRTMKFLLCFSTTEQVGMTTKTDQSVHTALYKYIHT